MLRTVLIVCGSRGDYGFVKPVIDKIKKTKGITYKTLLTNMHLIPKFGDSFREFEKDDINIDYKIYNTLDGYNNVTMTKSLGIFLLQFPEILINCSPDIVLISGDRGEQLMAAIACSNMNIPVAHIQAGEISGNVDGNSRHAITKLSHIHFCSNEDAQKRVKKLGEEDFRVFNVGAPQLDDLFDEDFPTKNIREKLKIPEKGEISLIINHSITEESDLSELQMGILLESISNFSLLKVIIMPNSDAGSLNVRKVISKYEARDDFYIFYNLPRPDFVAIMKQAKFIIGNSSSGIIEAPVFNIPAINIGRRQYGRYQCGNVINCEYEKEEIIKSIESVTFPMVKSGYGDGESSQKIVNILKNIKLNKDLLMKRIMY